MLLSLVKTWRGPSLMNASWSRGNNQIKIVLNDRGQPVMPEASPLATNMGVLVRDGSLLPLHYTDWRYVPAHYKKKVWEEIKDKDAGKKSTRIDTFIKTHTREDGGAVNEETFAIVARPERPGHTRGLGLGATKSKLLGAKNNDQEPSQSSTERDQQFMKMKSKVQRVWASVFRLCLWFTDQQLVQVFAYFGPIMCAEVNKENRLWVLHAGAIEFAAFNSGLTKPVGREWMPWQRFQPFHQLSLYAAALFQGFLIQNSFTNLLLLTRNRDSNKSACEGILKDMEGFWH
ncbi:hypothetical protein RHMOL_Rhmol03G0119100 [Rhododendron molle]|uniref:Uncharacterized protein n=1 Tax=Rhododendron molle TaxID=49168 RepID=A0ACC0PEU8_RHOML|nr:hypothetical protein RHMOL_Rhmol03G0119100 [Rhododendron molle]